MGSLMDMFAFKTPKQRERDAKKFDRWAFPYGEPQRQKVVALLKELLPKEEPKAALAVYLMGREAYRGSFKDDAEDLAERTEERKLRALDYQLKEQLFGRYRKFFPYYKVLVLADAQVDETLNYPSVEELRRRAEELIEEK